MRTILMTRVLAGQVLFRSFLKYGELKKDLNSNLVILIIIYMCTCFDRQQYLYNNHEKRN